MQDIREPISFFIDDINSLINYCSIDKEGRTLCSKRSFWKSQFDKFNLPLNEDVYYSNAYEWIQLLIKTKAIMNFINTPKKFESKDYDIVISLPVLFEIIEKSYHIDYDDLMYRMEEEKYPSEFLDAFENKYPMLINYISVSKRDNTYNISFFIITRNIRDIPGGEEIFQEGQYSIRFEFSRLTKQQMINILLNLLP